MTLLFLSPLFLLHTFDFVKVRINQSLVPMLILILPVGLCWFITNLAETNRAPFDFAEGESEIVSGFNIEYRRGGFALIFIAEYGRIIFISFITRVIFISFLPGSLCYDFVCSLIVLFLCFCFL